MNNPKILSLFLSLNLLTSALNADTLPTNNPLLDYYADDPYVEDYQWTEELNWTNVYDIRDYGAVADGNSVGDGVGVTDNAPAFEAAVQAAFEAGGGTVYIPEGVWYFSEDISLKDKVVIRGATPEILDAHSSDFSPPTKLEFPKYVFDPTANDGQGISNDTAFKSITVEDNSNASNLGMVFLDINRAGISMSADGNGTRNRVVFGVRSNNVAQPDPSIPQETIEIDTETVPFQKPWQRFSYRFARNILVFAQENVLVANNRVNDKHYTVDYKEDGWESIETDSFIQPGYVIRDTKKVFGSDGNALVELQEEHRPYFNYTDHYGINVRGGSPQAWGATPWEGPSLFRPGTTVRDNWVYTTMRVGYHLSGYGLKVLNNIKRDIMDKPWWLHPTGKTSISGAQTLENRSMDISGSQILVENNDLETFRHRANGGGYLSTDGEGILVQECCGGTTLDDIVIRKNKVNSYIGLYKMPYTRDIYIIENTMGSSNSGGASILVNANKNGSQAPVFDIFVEDNLFTGSGSIDVIGSSGGGNIVITGNTLSGGKINYPESISLVENNTGFSSQNSSAIGSVRDYPILEIVDPSEDGTLIAGETVTLTAKVPGSFLTPNPVSVDELPAIVSVELYVNETKIATLETATSTDDVNIANIYEAEWTPTPGFYQFAAKATPTGYSGPITSTEWFTVSEVVHLRVLEEQPDLFYEAWLTTYFQAETDPLIVGDQADPDMDNLPNMLEFALGSNPLVSDPTATPALIQDGDSTRFIFRLRDDLGDSVTYKLRKSSNMVSWETILLSEATPVENNELPEEISEYELSFPTESQAPLMIQLVVEKVK